MCVCCRLLARDAGGETEGVLLNETVPSWVVDIVVEKKLPKFIKVMTWVNSYMVFYLTVFTLNIVCKDGNEFG